MSHGEIWTTSIFPRPPSQADALTRKTPYEINQRKRGFIRGEKSALFDRLQIGRVGLALDSALLSWGQSTGSAWDVLQWGKRPISACPPEATYTMTPRIYASRRSQRGQGISEYVVMLALIVMLVAGTVHLVAANAKNALSKAASAIQHRSDSD
jgi:Flp pilus assembly pilin Flp